MLVIIYIIGYGRSGSTKLSQVLENKLGAINLGEVKYLYRDSKDDLLNQYWLTFKSENQDLLEEYSKEIIRFDNLFGFTRWNKREKYREIWEKLFDRVEIDPETDIIIDSSKTTLDSFMRGIYLNYAFNEVYFVKPCRSSLGVFRSLLKGKNSNIEKGEKKPFVRRLLHTLFIGFPHYIVTHLLSLFYSRYECVKVNLDSYEEDIDKFISQLPLKKRNIGTNRKIPLIYGNRSRKER